MNILVSACLLSLSCRYNEKTDLHAGVQKLMSKHTLIPFCPEIYGGLPTPREPAEQRYGRVYTKSGRDVTAQYLKGAREAVKLARLYDCELAILQARSPSCGHGKIHDGTFSGDLRPGEGVTAALLLRSGVRVIASDDEAAIAALTL